MFTNEGRLDNVFYYFLRSESFLSTYLLTAAISQGPSLVTRLRRLLTSGLHLCERLGLPFQERLAPRSSDIFFGRSKPNSQGGDLLVKYTSDFGIFLKKNSSEPPLIKMRTAVCLSQVLIQQKHVETFVAIDVHDHK